MFEVWNIENDVPLTMTAKATRSRADYWYGGCRSGDFRWHPLLW